MENIEVVESVLPKVGETVLIEHGSNGDGKNINVRSSVEKIARVYMDGSVGVGAGDVFTVKLSDKKAKWKTYIPKKKEE